MANKRGPKDVETGEKFKRMLPCPITPVKASKKADEIVGVLTEINHQKELSKPFKDKIRELTLKVESLRHDITEKTEDRDVQCVEERHYKTREIRIVRLDTRAVVESRTMTDDDRSPELPDLDPAGERKPGKLLAMNGGADAKKDKKEKKDEKPTDGEPAEPTAE